MQIKCQMFYLFGKPCYSTIFGNSSRESTAFPAVLGTHPYYVNGLFMQINSRRKKKPLFFSLKRNSKHLLFNKLTFSMIQYILLWTDPPFL